jgi:hypothetical protein
MPAIFANCYNLFYAKEGDQVYFFDIDGIIVASFEILVILGIEIVNCKTGSGGLSFRYLAIDILGISDKRQENSADKRQENSRSIAPHNTGNMSERTLMGADALG